MFSPRMGMIEKYGSQRLEIKRGSLPLRGDEGIWNVIITSKKNYQVYMYTGITSDTCILPLLLHPIVTCIKNKRQPKTCNKF